MSSCARHFSKIQCVLGEVHCARTSFDRTLVDETMMSGLFHAKSASSFRGSFTLVQLSYTVCDFVCDTVPHSICGIRTNHTIMVAELSP